MNNKPIKINIGKPILRLKTKNASKTRSNIITNGGMANSILVVTFITAFSAVCKNEKMPDRCSVNQLTIVSIQLEKGNCLNIFIHFLFS